MYRDESSYKFHVRIIPRYYVINTNKYMIRLYNLTMYFVICRYNLQTLMNRDYIVTNTSGVKYKFRVCGALTDTTCGTNTGVILYYKTVYCTYYDYVMNLNCISIILHAGICNSKRGTSLGQANTNLIWQQGGPYLNYTNGDLCENGMRHYTLIGFLCEPQGSPNQPLLIKEYPCQTVVHWSTDLVCEKKVGIIICVPLIFLFLIQINKRLFFHLDQMRYRY